MRESIHDKIAREVARRLHLDERLVLVGSKLPDLDLFLKHRKTLHNPMVLALSGIAGKSVFLGYASHLFFDLFSKPYRAYEKAKRVIKSCLE